MQIYDKQKLMEALKEMAEAEPAEELQDLKKLFLLMAREKRMLKQTTMEDIAAVSYTHLDVYKRQGGNSVGRNKGISGPGI